MTTAGELRQRVTFQLRPLVDDGFGNMVPGGAWEDQFAEHAKIHFLRGGETVIAARLSGTKAAVITVRANSNTMSATPAWRLVDGDETEWDIKSISDPDGRNTWLDILAETGGN